MSTRAVWYRTQGDTNDTLSGTFVGVTDLLGVTTIETHVWLTGGTTVDTLATAVTDAAACTYRVNLASWITTAAPGVYNLEVQATWFGPTVATSPSKPGLAMLVIRAQGA